jgi:hypothetical protein
VRRRSVRNYKREPGGFGFSRAASASGFALLPPLGAFERQSHFDFLINA